MARIRTIKPEFWKHEGLSALSEAAHLLAAALLNYADDEGYFNANPKLVQAECFPIREPSTNIRRLLVDLSSIGYIRLGGVADGRCYGQVVKFLQHQRIDRPKASHISQMEIVWDDSTIARRFVDDASLLEVEVEVEVEVEGKGNTTFALTSADAESTPEPPVYRLPLIPKDGHCDIMAEQVLKWRETYPGIDVDLEIRKTIAWTDANPAKRKTKAGAMRFINAWLSKAQDMSGRNGAVGGRTGNGGTYGQPRDRGSAGLRPFEGDR